MAKLTQTQIRHLRIKVDSKIQQKRKSTSYQARLTKLFASQHHLRTRGIFATLKTMPASEVKKLALEAHAGEYERSLSRLIRDSKAYSKVVEIPLREIEEEIATLNDAVDNEVAALRVEGELLIDKAVFAGSSEEILGAIEVFMGK